MLTITHTSVHVADCLADQAKLDAAWLATHPEPSVEEDDFGARRKARFDGHAAKGEKRWIVLVKPPTRKQAIEHNRKAMAGECPTMPRSSDEKWLTDEQALDVYHRAIHDDLDLVYDLRKESDVWWYGETDAMRAMSRARVQRWAIINKMGELSIDRQIELIESVKLPTDEYTLSTDKTYICIWSDVSDATMAKLGALLDAPVGEKEEKRTRVAKRARVA